MPPAVPAGGAPLSCLPPGPVPPGPCCEQTVILNPAHLWCPHVTPSCSQISLLSPTECFSPTPPSGGSTLAQTLHPRGVITKVG